MRKSGYPMDNLRAKIRAKHHHPVPQQGALRRSNRPSPQRTRPMGAVPGIFLTKV